MSRILWYSGAPWVPSGYGQQTKLFVPRLAAAGHHVAIAATWGLGGSGLDWNGVKVYPASEKPGNWFVRQYAKLEKADVIIGLLDAWVLNPDAFRNTNTAIWTPVDHQPAPPNVVKFFKESGARTIAMSRFGQRMLAAEGLDPLYVPHGVDTNVFKPSDDRMALRRSMEIPDEAFVVGMVANNMGTTPPRKAFPQVIMAFSMFRDKHPDAVIYFHSEVFGNNAGGGKLAGVNILDLCERYGVPATAFKYSDPLLLEMGGYPPETMADLYNTFDVLVNPSYGEGFGIPIIEAQACGTPVIVSDWTSMPELCGAGWLVEGEPMEDWPQRAMYLYPLASSIYEQLENAYAAKGDQTVRDRARKFALDYDVDKITAEYWMPALEQLGGPREVPPLAPLNRQMRRAAGKRKAAA